MKSGTRTVAVAAVLAAAGSVAPHAAVAQSVGAVQQAPAPGTQAPAPPGAQVPGTTTPAPTAPGTAAPLPGSTGVLPAAPVASRTFTTPVGLLFHTVRPERVADFERVIGYLEAALQKSSDPTVQAQAKGWRAFRVTEPGPNSTVLYAFVIDPVAPGADYGLGRILADGYPETVQLQEIWKLYQGAVTSGGTLLSLTRVVPGAALPLTVPTVPAATTPAPAPRPLPPDADPARLPPPTAPSTTPAPVAPTAPPATTSVP